MWGGNHPSVQGEKGGGAARKHGAHQLSDFLHTSLSRLRPARPGVPHRIEGGFGRARGRCLHAQAARACDVRQDLLSKLLSHVGEIRHIAPERLPLLVCIWCDAIGTLLKYLVEIVLQLAVEQVCLLLNVPLKVLEQILFSRVFIQVVPIDVSPLEHPPARAHLSEGIVEELQLYNLETMNIMKLLDLVIDFGLRFDCHVHAFVMLHETFKVKHVLVKRVLRPLSTRLFLRMFAFFRLLVVNIALVVAPSGRSMGCPVAQAQPAELMATTASSGTDHVVASLVLLYSSVALRALLGIGTDPADILRLCTVLDVP